MNAILGALAGIAISRLDISPVLRRPFNETWWLELQFPSVEMPLLRA